MRIEATRENLHGVFDPELPPVATVQSGQEVSFETLEVGWRTGRVVADGSAPRLEPRYTELDDGPALTGPVAVAGARPGQLLEIEILKVNPGSWGWNSAPGYLCKNLNAALEVHDKASVFWEIDHDGGVAVNQFGHRVPLAPFPGTLGIAPSQGRVDGWTPRALTGGNLDLKLLSEGARMFFWGA